MWRLLKVKNRDIVSSRICFPQSHIMIICFPSSGLLVKKKSVWKFWNCYHLVFIYLLCKYNTLHLAGGGQKKYPENWQACNMMRCKKMPRCFKWWCAVSPRPPNELTHNVALVSHYGNQNKWPMQGVHHVILAASPLILQKSYFRLPQMKP